MALSSFVQDSFQVTDTRSLHSDTENVSFTLVGKPQSGKGTPQALTKAMCDVNNGVHAVDLSFSNIPENPTDAVTFNCVMLNSGRKRPSGVVSLLEMAGLDLLAIGATAAGDAIGSLLDVPGPRLAFAPWFGGQIVSYRGQTHG